VHCAVKTQQKATFGLILLQRQPAADILHTTIFEMLPAPFAGCPASTNHGHQ